MESKMSEPESPKYKEPTVEGVCKDKDDAVEKCMKIILEAITPYDPKIRYFIGGRIVNHLWAWIYKPTMTTVMETAANELNQKGKQNDNTKTSEPDSKA